VFVTMRTAVTVIVIVIVRLVMRVILLLAENFTRQIFLSVGVHIYFGG